MAEANVRDKTTSHKSYFQQNRTSYSNRGRGRLDPHVSKALHKFGVTDLRELLDRKHQGQDQSKDPSYSYLNDPLRENTNCNNQTRKYCSKDRPEHISESYSRGRGSRNCKGKNAHINRDDMCSQLDRSSIIQNPINIKIALTTSTGERSCKLDEKSKLVDIKHIYNHRPQERKACKGMEEGDRGKDEENGASCENRKERNDINSRKEFRGKSVQRMGHNWRGKGKYNNLSNKNNRRYCGGNSNQNVKETEVPTEENWDAHYLMFPLEKNETNFGGEKGAVEKAYTQNSGEYEKYLEADDVVHLDVFQKSLLQRETGENLVMPSSVPQINAESGKRTVKFKEGEEHDAVQSEQAVDKKSQEDKETLNMQENEVEAKTNKIIKQKFPSKYEINQVKRVEKKINEKKPKVNEKLKPLEVAKVEIIKGNTKKQIESKANEKLINEDVLRSAIKEESPGKQTTMKPKVKNIKKN